MSSQLLCPVKDGPNQGRLLLWEHSRRIPRQQPEHFGNAAPHLQVKEIRLCVHSWFPACQSASKRADLLVEQASASQ